MQIDHEQEPCRHPGCRCTVPKGDGYCGESCRSATEGTSSSEVVGRPCACGHDACNPGGDERAVQ